MTRHLDNLTGLSSGGAITAIFGAITGDSVLSWIGVAGAIGAALISWVLAQRAKVREEARREQWADFLLQWKIDQAKAGKLDPTAETPVPTMPARALAHPHSEGS